MKQSSVVVISILLMTACTTLDTDIRLRQTFRSPAAKLDRLNQSKFAVQVTMDAATNTNTTFLKALTDSGQTALLPVFHQHLTTEASKLGASFTIQILDASKQIDYQKLTDRQGWTAREQFQFNGSLAALGSDYLVDIRNVKISRTNSGEENSDELMDDYAMEYDATFWSTKNAQKIVAVHVSGGRAYYSLGTTLDAAMASAARELIRYIGNNGIGELKVE